METNLRASQVMRTRIKFGRSEGLTIGIVQSCGQSLGLKVPKEKVFFVIVQWLSGISTVWERNPALRLPALMHSEKKRAEKKQKKPTQKKFQSSPWDKPPELSPMVIKQEVQYEVRFPRSLNAWRCKRIPREIFFKGPQEQFWHIIPLISNHVNCSLTLSTISTADETFICLIRQLHTFRDFHTRTVHHYLLL